MKLKKLTIENFKGIKNFTLNADGQNVSILGVNGAGKTTVADSVAWLLYDQDSLGNKKFNPKPIMANGNSKHGVCSEVEAVFFGDDGSGEIILKKSFREEWTRGKGKAKKIFTGHTTIRYIDTIETSKKRFDKKIVDVFAEKHILKMLMNVKYFSEGIQKTKDVDDPNRWDSQTRRDFIMSMSPDMPSDADIIISDSKLKRLPEILDGKNFYSVKAILKKKQKELNKQIDEIPIRRDEKEKELPDMTDIELDIQDIEQKQKMLSIQLSEANEAKVRIESGGEIAKKDKELRILETDLLKLQNKDTVLRFQKEAEDKKEKLRLENVKDVELSNQNKLANTIAANIEKNEISKKAMADLRVKWAEINKIVFDEAKKICPTCHQKYPAEKAQKLKETFNINKSERLTKINKTGKELSAEVDDRLEDNEKFEADIVTYNVSIKKLVGQILCLNAPEIGKTDPMQDKIVSDIEKIKKEIEGLKSGSKESLEKAQADIDTVQKDLEAVALQKSSIDTYQKSLARIDELKAQQKVCASEFESLEEKLFIMENFIKAKVALLETKVNDYFKLAKFKLFDQQVNGELNPICEVTYNGVPWNNGLNNGAKINVGIDIINTLMDFHGLTMPVFVDNAESVIDIIESESQVIRLVVDKKHKQLEVIKEGANA